MRRTSADAVALPAHTSYQDKYAYSSFSSVTPSSSPHPIVSSQHSATNISPLMQLGLLEKSDPSLVVSQITPSSSSNSNGHYKMDNAHKTEDNSHLEYGFVPKSIINAIKDKDWKVRSEAVEKFFELVTHLPPSPPDVLPHMPNLIRFLSKLLFDPNFTICLTTIRLIGELVPKLSHHIKPTLTFLLPNIIEKFGDSKVIIRQETMKVVSKIMRTVSPSSVIDVLKACFDEKSPKEIHPTPSLNFSNKRSSEL